MTNVQTARRAALAAALAAAAAAPAAAQDLAGKTVDYVIPFSESGGSAQWANFYAPLMSEALPGNPTVVVRYRPGAGSTEGANWFQENQGTGDGSVVFGDSGSTKFPYLLGDPRVRYEYKEWKPILASGTGGVVYLPPDLGERFDGDMDDLQDEVYQTTVISKNRSPMWNANFQWSLPMNAQLLTIAVIDHDTITRDNLVGPRFIETLRM